MFINIRKAKRCDSFALNEKKLFVYALYMCEEKRMKILNCKCIKLDDNIHSSSK